MDWVNYLIFPLIVGGVGIWCTYHIQNRIDVSISVKCGLIPPLFGYDTTPRFKTINVDITNLSRNDCYIKTINLRFKKGSDEKLVTELESTVIGKKIMPQETVVAKLSPERVCKNLSNVNYPIVRCEVVVSSGKRFVSRYVDFVFDHPL